MYVNTLPPTIAYARQRIRPRFARVGRRPPIDAVRLHFTR